MNKDKCDMVNTPDNIDPVKIDDSIQLLKKYIDESSITQVISILEELKQNPNDTSLLAQFPDALNNTGVIKGAVLTYAPYLILLLSDDPFANN